MKHRSQRDASGLRPLLGVLVSAGLTLFGCVSETAGFREIQSLAAERLGQRILAPDLSKPKPSELDAATQQLLTQPLTLNDALHVATLHSPKVRQAFARLGISRADLLSAYRPANPTAELAVRFGRSGTTIELHAFENLVSVAVLPLAVGSAAAQSEAAQLESSEQIVAELFRVKAAYIEWIASGQLRALEAQLLEAQRASQLAAEELFQAGNLREPLRLSELSLREDGELELARVSLEFERSETRLRDVLGVWQDVSLKLPEALPTPAAPDKLANQLESSALRNSLALRSLTKRYEAAAKASNLASLRGWLPSVGVGVSAERDRDGWSLGPALSLSAPLLDQGQGASAKATALALLIRERLFETAAQIRSQARATLFTLEQTKVANRRVVEDLIPARTQLLERTQREYNAMLIGVFELLQAKRALLQAEKAQVRWQREWLLALTRAEQLVAGSLPQPVTLDDLTATGIPQSGGQGGH